MNPTSGHSLAKAGAEVSPPAGLVAWHYFTGLPIEKWLTALAIVYTVLQIVVLIRKEFVKRRKGSDHAA